MNDYAKQKMGEVLLGKATIREKQDVLAHVDDAGLEEILKDPSVETAYEQYLKQHPDYTLSRVNLSKEQIDQSWDRIVERSLEETPARRGLFSMLKEIWANCFPADQSFQRYAAVMAAFFMFFCLPAIYYHTRPNTSAPFNAMRGPAVSQKAALDYSILGPDNKLHRPDRALFESDTLFFRVEAKEDGFCSLYIIHHGQADIIVSDHFLKQGSHDLSTGYKLTGNTGENRLVLVFSSLPVSMDKEYIVASINNKVKSLTVNDTQVSISQTELRVE